MKIDLTSEGHGKENRGNCNTKCCLEVEMQNRYWNEMQQNSNAKKEILNCLKTNDIRQKV